MFYKLNYSKETVLEIFEVFPYLFVVKPEKVEYTLKFFKEKGFSKEDVE